MKKETRSILMTCVGGLLLCLLCGYMIITYGHSALLSVGLLIGSVVTLSGFWAALNQKKD